MVKPSALIRPLVHRLHAYVPGEQPAIPGLIKLNTNENPNPPAPGVLAAVRAAADSRLRLYPNPTASKLRHQLAALHRCRPENILVGNGSDELLALAVRAFVEPATPSGTRSSRSVVQTFHPSYSLYPVLAAIHGSRFNAVPLNPDFSLPRLPTLKRGQLWDFSAALSFITTPNAPSGRGYQTRELQTLCAAQKGVVVLDEAYVDFAPQNAMKLALTHPNVLVARTFSKAYSLCFLRVGYCVGHPDLIAALDKIRDSYNVNGLAQAAAEATLDNLPYYHKCWQKVISTREWLTLRLRRLGFDVLPSQTNFILTRPPGPPARDWLQTLREHKILVRWFDAPEIRQYLRITIGTHQEAARLASVATALLKKPA